MTDGSMHLAAEWHYVVSVLTGWWLMNTHPLVGMLLMASAIWAQRRVENV